MSSVLLLLVAVGCFLAGWFLSERKNLNLLAAAKDYDAMSAEHAEKLNAISTTHAEISASAAQRNAQVSENMVALTTGVNALEATLQAKLERLALVVDALDRNQGATLAGLISVGIIKSVTGGAPDLTQVGEEPLTRTRPARVDRVTMGGEEEPALR